MTPDHCALLPDDHPGPHWDSSGRSWPRWQPAEHRGETTGDTERIRYDLTYRVPGDRLRALKAAADRSNVLARRTADLADELDTVRAELVAAQERLGEMQVVRDDKIKQLALALGNYYTTGGYPEVVRLVKAAAAVIGS